MKSLEKRNFFGGCLDNDEVFKKVPKDAKEDWKSLLETLRNIEHSRSHRQTFASCRGAIEGWYQDYLRATYGIGRDEKRIWKA